MSTPTTTTWVHTALVPLDVMRNDATFMRTLRQCTQSLCEKQSQALGVVLDKVEEFRKNGVPANSTLSATRGGRGGARGASASGGRGEAVERGHPAMPQRVDGHPVVAVLVPHGALRQRHPHHHVVTLRHGREVSGGVEALHQ